MAQAERPGFESQACHLLTCDLVQDTKPLLSHFFTCKMCTIQSQRKAIPKNTQTTTQLHSSYMLVK